VVGTKEGTLDVLDVGASSRLQSVEAHAGAVWSLAALPDNRYALEGHSTKSCFAVAQRFACLIELAKLQWSALAHTWAFLTQPSTLQQEHVKIVIEVEQVWWLM